MSNDFDCPLWSGALSFEGGLKRRLCCHDETGSFEDFSVDKKEFEILNQVRDFTSSGKIPPNCIGCFKSEENSGNSPRLFYKEFYSKTNCEEDLLKYVDITFENICNLSCFTCKPIYSNKVENEFNKLNIPYNNKGINAKELKEKFSEIKDYILSRLSKDALVVISGGEPSLSSNVENFLEELSFLEYSNTLTLRVFSNLTMSTDWILKYLKNFKRVEFVISIDAIEQRAEYVRFPSKWKKIEENYNNLAQKSLENTNLEVSVHSVLSILNFDQISSLINYFYTSKLEIFPEFTVLSSPKFYGIENLSNEKILDMKNKILIYLDSLKTNNLNKDKISAFRDLVNSFKSSKKSLMMELVLHHKKIDKLRNTSLFEEIPYIK
jgi:organic radical activating enzyme